MPAHLINSTITMGRTPKVNQELRESVQEIFLAGVGALAKAEEEGTKLFQKLVKRGQDYQGPAADQVKAVRQELESRLVELRELAGEVQSEADLKARRARAAVGEQVGRTREGLETMVDSVEGRIERAVAGALKSLGVPTRDELEALRQSLQQLTKALDGAEARSDPEPAITSTAVGGGWFEIRVHDVVVDRLRGREAAEERLEQLRRQDFDEAGPGEITVEATGGGWYEVRLDGVAVDKVQGRRAADAAVMRIEQQYQQ